MCIVCVQSWYRWYVQYVYLDGGADSTISQSRPLRNRRPPPPPHCRPPPSHHYRYHHHMYHMLRHPIPRTTTTSSSSSSSCNTPARTNQIINSAWIGGLCTYRRLPGLTGRSSHADLDVWPLLCMGLVVLQGGGGMRPSRARAGCTCSRLSAGPAHGQNPARSRKSKDVVHDGWRVCERRCAKQSGSKILCTSGNAT